MYSFDNLNLCCGCICSLSENHVIKFCKFHDSNQPRVGDPLYIYLLTKGNVKAEDE